jgi:GNAT superfamily N-acetyltransferase
MTQKPRKLRLVLLDDTINVEKFSCNAKPNSVALETFFQKNALDNQHKKITITYVTLGKYNEPVGFFSIACGSIHMGNLPKKQKSHIPVRDRYPALYIARFAVADKYQNTGVGTWMMEQLFAKAIHVSEEVGCRYIIVQSKPSAKGFYEKKFGFVRSKEMKNGSTMYYKSMITLTHDFHQSI